MIFKSIYAFSVLVLSFCTMGNPSRAQSVLSYPSTRSEAFDTVIYNKKLSDNYAWLSRPENNMEMLAWAKNQGIFTNNVLDSIGGDDIIKGLLDKIYSSSQNDIIVRGTQGNDIYYSKTMADHKRWLLKKTSGDENEEKIIAMPFTVNGKRYTAQKFAFAYNKKIVAIMLVESGESNPHIRFFNLESKTFLEDSIGPVMFNDASGVSMAWLPDDKGLIYAQAPGNNQEEEKYYRGQLKLHRLGDENGQDTAIFGFEVARNIPIREYETPYIYSFPHSPYLIARIRAGKGDNYAYAIHYSQLNGAATAWIKLKDYTSNHGTFTASADQLYAIDDAVPNMQLIKVDLKTGSTPVVVHKESDKILAMSTGDPSIISGRNTIYIKYTAPGKQGILKMGSSEMQPKDMELAFEGSVGEFNLLGENDLLFVTTNWTTNYVYHAINHLTNTTTAVFQSDKTAINTNAYETTVFSVPSRDGVSIPVSLVHKKINTLKEKPLPLLIDAYGCFGSSMDPVFMPDLLVWLEMGGIYAAAHIRGGSELGAQWYASGAYPSKMNSINDIVDIAEYFVKNKYTSADKQAITGTSCGTLNVGLATLQRPDLFSAGVYRVGIPDLVTNKGPSFGRGQNDFGPLDTEAGFQSRYSLSAYYHIVPDKSAPAMLVINGANDYIVPLHNNARYVAKLQHVQQSYRPALFMVDWNNGHAGAGSDPEDIIRMWKFLFWQTGHDGFQRK